MQVVVDTFCSLGLASVYKSNIAITACDLPCPTSPRFTECSPFNPSVGAERPESAAQRYERQKGAALTAKTRCGGQTRNLTNGRRGLEVRRGTGIRRTVADLLTT